MRERIVGLCQPQMVMGLGDQIKLLAQRITLGDLPEFILLADFLYLSFKVN